MKFFLILLIACTHLAFGQKEGKNRKLQERIDRLSAKMERIDQLSAKIADLKHTLFLASAPKEKWLINSSELISEGIGLYNEGKYEEAISIYNQISRNDTNYARALGELALSYLATKDYELAQETCQKGLSLKSGYDNHFYNSLGTALDKSDKPEEAIAIYEKAIGIFPYNYLLYFNLAITQYNSPPLSPSLRSREGGRGVSKKKQEAEANFKKAVELNPFHASSHYYLGIIAAERGWLVPAMLSLELFLIIEPATTRSQRALFTLEAIVQGTLPARRTSTLAGGDVPNMDKDNPLIPTELSGDNQDNFNDLELIIQSRIALDKKYKSQVKIYDPLIKQTQVLLEKLQYNKKDKGFWMQHYVPFFNNLYNDDYFVPFIYYILFSADNDKVNKWINKNMDRLKSFGQWATDQIMLHKNKSYYYYNDYAISAIGNTIPLNPPLQRGIKGDLSPLQRGSPPEGDLANTKIGPWLYFHPNGMIKVKGEFDDEGSRIGLWEWYYENGTLQRTSNYKNGKLNGLYQYSHFYNNFCNNHLSFLQCR